MNPKLIKWARYSAIFATASAAYPIYQGFQDMPLILVCICMMMIAAIISPNGFDGLSGLPCMGVYLLLMAFFGLFASFQLYRIITAILAHIDALLIKIFNLF